MKREWNARAKTVQIHTSRQDPAIQTTIDSSAAARSTYAHAHARVDPFDV